MLKWYVMLIWYITLCRVMWNYTLCCVMLIWYITLCWYDTLCYIALCYLALLMRYIVALSWCDTFLCCVTLMRYIVTLHYVALCWYDTLPYFMFAFCCVVTLSKPPKLVLKKYLSLALRYHIWIHLSEISSKACRCRKRLRVSKSLVIQLFVWIHVLYFHVLRPCIYLFF